MPDAAHQAAEAINRLVADGEVPSGSLRVFGDWFGRPHDNWHRPSVAEASGSLLTVHFEGGETLRVREPGVITVTASVFRVRTAVRVRWEWFAYGRDQTPENLCAEEHWVEDGHVRVTSTGTWARPSADSSLVHPAVELL